MERRFLAFIICFLRTYQVSHSIGLTIDNQLVIIADDCYTRVAIGSKLPGMDIFSNVAVVSISECEDECSKRRNSCNAFAFGISVKGNGTCALSMKMPKPEELLPHADYDVYVRSQRAPHCEPDRLYKTGSDSIERHERNETKPITGFGSGLLNPTMPSPSSPRTTESTMYGITNKRLHQEGSSYDEKHRIDDILKNRDSTPPVSPFEINNPKVNDYDDLSIYSDQKSTFGQRIHLNPSYDRHTGFAVSSFKNPFANINHLYLGSNLDSDVHSYKAITIHNGPFEIFSRPIFAHDERLKNKSPANFGFWTDHSTYRNAIANHFDQHQDKGYFNDVYKNQGTITKPKQNELSTTNYDIGKMYHPISNSYDFDTNGERIGNGGFKDISKIWSPQGSTGFRDFGARITGKLTSCFRRLLSGKKSLDSHVRRAIECERLDECHRACDYEKYFICEGFNYRRIGHGTRGMCELTSVPYSRMDLHRDFISDSQCDYYEKDPNCASNAPGIRPYWNQQSRPSQSYGPPYSTDERPDTRPYPPDRPLNEVPRPLDYDQRPLKEVPRPFDFDRRPSNEIPRPLDYNHRPANHDRRPPTIYGPPHHGQYDAFDRRGYPNDQDSFRGRYPVARPGERYDYSVRYLPRRPADDDFYNRNPPWTGYPSRRTDHGSTHDIGTNEISSYLPDHRKDPTRDWDSYGTTYGHSYGYDTNYVSKFDVSKYYPKPQLKPPHPYENDHFYGEFYNYGGAFGYGDNYIPANQDPIYGGTVKTEECSVRAGAGFRLSRRVVRKTYLTPNLDQCESLCISEKSYVCMSFSYRYNVAPTDPTDNCLLSDISYKDLNFYIDLEPDRDYDIYAVITNSRTCGTRKESSSHLSDECFWRVRSGFGMPTDVVRKSIIVDNLGECQAECTITQEFMCRSFTFKYGLEKGHSADTQTNCYLSDWPSQDINPAHMPDMDGAELYERGSFGRGCEPYTVPFFNMGQFKQPSQEDEGVCYSGYNKPCKLTPYAVLLATYVNSEQDCRQKCSKMRETDSIPCMAYSYKLTTHGTEENCLLSDVPIRDLRPGIDYMHDNDHVLYAWKDLDPYCMVTGYSIDDDHVFGGPGPHRPLLPGPSRPNFSSGEAGYPSRRPDNNYPNPRPFLTKPNGNHYGITMRPAYDPDRPDPIAPVRPYPPGGGYGGDKFGYGNRPAGFGYGSFYPDEQSTFRFYTVNGYPCRKGTKCEKNKIAGFWTCEPEGSEYGSWDYCCAPTHHCGFSQGYNYPWCYVGSSEEQWRPCSEKYFPYLPSPRPFRPKIAGDDRHDRPDQPHPNSGYDYGRHWPITYLHRGPPPNCTDSVASADNSGSRRSNETISSTSETPSSTTIKDDNSTAIVSGAYRQRLRTRTAVIKNSHNDRRTILSRKVDKQGVIKAQSHENQTSRERIAKIERVSKPINGTSHSDNMQLEGAKSNDSVEMIRVPLIMSNNSLPATGA